MSIDVLSNGWVAHVAEVLQARRTADKNDPVEQFFLTPIPQRLWHYTSLDGLRGILSTDRVWATDAGFTPDITEFVHAREIARAYLDRQDPRTDAGRFAKEIGLKLVEEEFETGTLSAAQTEVFIASFCSTANLKSQWVEYGDAGKGVGIAFALGGRRPPAEYKIAVTLAPCVYSRSDAESLVYAALKHFLSTAAQLHADTNDLRWVARQRADWKLVDMIFNLPFDRAAFDRQMEQRSTGSFALHSRSPSMTFSA